MFPFFLISKSLLLIKYFLLCSYFWFVCLFICCFTESINIVAGRNQTTEMNHFISTIHSNLFLIVFLYTSQHMPKIAPVLLLESARDQQQPPSRTWQELHRRTPELPKPSRCYNTPCILLKLYTCIYCCRVACFGFL